MQRLRLELSEALVGHDLREQGLHRTWFWPSTATTTIFEFAREIHARFQLNCPGGPAALRLAMGGFTLPPDGPMELLRDGDLISVGLLARPPVALTLESQQGLLQQQHQPQLQQQQLHLLRAPASGVLGGALIPNAGAVGAGADNGAGGEGGGRKRKRGAAAGAGVAGGGEGGAAPSAPSGAAAGWQEGRQGQEEGDEEQQGQQWRRGTKVHRVPAGGEQQTASTAIGADAGAGVAVAQTTQPPAGAAAPVAAVRASVDVALTTAPGGAVVAGMTAGTVLLAPASGAVADGACGAAAAAATSPGDGDMAFPSNGRTANATEEAGTVGTTVAIKAPSRSALRKAHKRRMRRMGFLPYKGAGAHMAAVVAAGACAPGQPKNGSGQNQQLRIAVVPLEVTAALGNSGRNESRRERPEQPQPQHQGQGQQKRQKEQQQQQPNRQQHHWSQGQAQDQNLTAAKWAAALAASPLNPNGVLPAAAVCSGYTLHSARVAVSGDGPGGQQQQQHAQAATAAVPHGLAAAGPSSTHGPTVAAAAGDGGGRSSSSSSTSEGSEVSSDEEQEGRISDRDGRGGGGATAGRKTPAVAQQQGQGQEPKQPVTARGAEATSSSSSSRSSSRSDDDDDSDDDSDGDNDSDDGAAAAGGGQTVPTGKKAAAVAATSSETTSSSSSSSSSSEDDGSSEDLSEEAPVVAKRTAGAQSAAAALPATRIAYDSLPAVQGSVAVGDVLAYKLLEIGADMSPRVSNWRQGRVAQMDAVTGVVVLAPHPDPRVHPLQEDLDALRARLAAEAAGGDGDGSAGARKDVELDWAALPFPTEYDSAGTLALTLDRLVDVRTLSTAATAAATAPGSGAEPRAPAGARSAASPAAAPPAAAAAVSGSGAKRPAARVVASGPAAQTPRAARTPAAPTRGGAGPRAPRQASTPRPQWGTPGAAVSRPPPPQPQPRPGVPATAAATVIRARTPAKGTSAAAPRGLPPPSLPEKQHRHQQHQQPHQQPGAVIPAVGGWDEIAEQLRRRRMELSTPASTPPPDAAAPPASAAHQEPPPPHPHPPPHLGESRQPPQVPEVATPGFMAVSPVAAGNCGVGCGTSPAADPASGGKTPEAAALAALPPSAAEAGPASQAEQPRGAGQENGAHWGGNGSQAAAGIRVPGPAKPRGGARHVAIGPLLSHLRRSGAL